MDVTPHTTESEEQTFEMTKRAKLRARIRKKSSIYFKHIPHFDDTSISFHDISYVIRQRTFLKSTPPKIILNNVSGIMKAGLHAIMGPTGCGKTTLLDILADRKAKKGLSGDVLINGKRQPHNFKCSSAYVVQDDIVVGTLTVKENLTFSAALRLPKQYTWVERKEKVETAIDELGLRKVANSKIGTELLRGVSGGERKRTSIGMELIISPDFVFLDEPTTGLDSATAISVLKLLKDLSTTDRVIVLAIHQPRYSIFKLFDSLTLLSNGEMVYHGPAESAISYFSRIGYVCEQHDNPADFFLDVICANERSAIDEAPQETTSLTTVFKKSHEHEEIKTILKPLLDDASHSPRGMSPKYNTYFPWQFLVVSARTTLNILRDPLLALTQILVTVSLAVLVGIVFLQIEGTRVGVQNRIGAIFFVLINLSFGSLFSIEFVIREGIIFRHENTSGYYRVSAYFLAKVICDLVPLRILPTILYGTITYWMIGFEPEASKFFIYLFTLILTSAATAGVAFTIAALVNIVSLANITAAFVYIFMLVFTGFLININSLGVWISWLQYISIFRYSLHAMAVNELSDNIYCNTITVTTFDDDTNTTSSTSMCDITATIIGNDFLKEQEYDVFPLWLNELALVLICAGYFLLTYIILRILRRKK